MARQSRNKQGNNAGQLDLFESNSHTPVGASFSKFPSEVDVLTDLTDQKLLTMVPKANLSNVQILCEQVLNRSLGDEAVQALETLWHRFRGYGKTDALPEQRCALETLAEISTPAAKESLTKIARATQSEGLLPLVLKAAVRAKLALPLRQVEKWQDHRLPEVRVRAYTLIRRSNPPVHVLETGLSDPYPAVRRAALITAGTLGHGFAKPGLLRELEKNPTGQVVEALLEIMDEDILVCLGRCATQHDELHLLILEGLKDSDNPRARKVALNIGAPA